MVGVGQITDRPTAGAAYRDRPTPLSLMAHASELALLDSGSDRLRAAITDVVAVRSFTWHPSDPARLLADAVGCTPEVRTSTTTVGGNIPQLLLHQSAARIVAGEDCVILVAGSEAMHAASIARKEGIRPEWRDEKSESATLLADEDVPLTALEYAAGLTQPTDCYPHFENARRIARGWTKSEHLDRVGRIWSRFADVAAHNPYAWLRDGASSDVITTVTDRNRLVASPYTKTMVANLPVDMGAAYVVMSAGRALELGISADRFVFPHVGADASDHWFISDRLRLDDSPAMRLLLESIQSTGVSADDLDAFDIYSCFPTVVQTAAEILGVDPLADERPLTLTGGLTFGGGPGNNYTTHGICQMVDTVRGTSRRGLTTGLGWFSTKHSWGVMGGAPATELFRHFLRQEDVDALPRCETLALDGDVTIESFTVVAGRDNELIRSTIAGRHLSGVRTWARNDSPDVAQELLTRESPEMAATIANGQFTLRGS